MEKTFEGLSREVFENPPASFRGAPFWAWNCTVDQEKIRKQVGYFREMGFGGFHIHCRTGMNTVYLSDAFMDFVRYSEECAKENGLLCRLYDEDRYASGFGGGYVTKNREYQERYLVFSPDRPGADYADNAKAFYDACEKDDSLRGYFLASYCVELKDERLAAYEYRVGEYLPEGDNVWYAYLEWSEKSSWWNNETYVNTLSREAIDEFIRVTYERYFELFADSFGKTMPSVFTDEPQFAQKQRLDFAKQRKRLVLPYTDDFAQTYKETCGMDFFAHLPELFFELPDGKLSEARYWYHNHLTDRFAGAYARNIGSWCEKHGISLAGHMKGEETLASQTEFVGECMRSLRYFQLPGHDVLCDQRDYATAKQAQSVARQYGRYGALSELYGVTNWDFDFRRHKLQGDWQAALGITVRVPHLSWMSMEGEAKRDYPASIGYQSPWYKKYSCIEDHFARVNTAMTRGKAVVRIAVIHPIESYWLYFGVNGQTYRQRDRMEQNYRNITEWLLFGQLDFDFISEALLEEQVKEEDSENAGKEGSFGEKTRFRMGEMLYDAVIVPGCVTLRSNTVRRLRKFSQAGGKVIFLGDSVRLIDAKPSDEGHIAASEAVIVPFEKEEILEALEEQREIEVVRADQSRCDTLFYQLREEGGMRYLFLARAYERIDHSFWDMVNSTDYPYVEPVTIRLKGTYSAKFLDTMNGTMQGAACRYENGMTLIDWKLSVHGSLLLALTEGKEAFGTDCYVPEMPFEETKGRLEEPVSTVFSEENVLLLDMAEHALNDEPWNPKEDILKIDNLYRRMLGLPVKEEAGAQPWTYVQDTDRPDMLRLRFLIESEIDAEAFLALETPEDAEILVNGETVVPKEDCGYFTDDCIRKIRIPMLKRGINELILRIPYGRSSNIEPCYLLGDFGVRAVGNTARIIKKEEHILWGDLSEQGYPFYGGNVTYTCGFESSGEEEELKIPYFTGPLLEVSVDKGKSQPVFLAPYTVRLTGLKPGKHTIAITAYGNRYQTFGQLHNADKQYDWVGSCAWRTKGDRWCCEYQKKPSGILIAPMRKRRKQ